MSLRMPSLWQRISSTLSGRLTLAFVLLVIVSIGAVLIVWRAYRASTFERASADLMASQVQAALVLVEAFGDDPLPLHRAVAASGLRLQIDGAMPEGDRLRPPLISNIERRATEKLGLPIHLEVRLMQPRAAWARFHWRNHEMALTFPLDDWEAGLPLPVMLWLGLIVALSPAVAGLAVFWLQHPLQRVAADIDAQHDRPAPVVVPDYASSEVITLVSAYNRVAAEVNRRDREREQILAGVSHDLKAPLTRLRMRVLSTDDEILAAGVVRDVAALDRIAEQFLTFVRSGIEAHESGAPCRADTVIQGLIGSLDQTQCAAVTLNGVATAVRCNPDTLERIVANLLDNAFEYGTPPIEIRLDTEGSWVRLGVIDHGEGMEPEALQRAMEPFVRLDPARGKPGHCGLGLAIVARLVDQAGGQCFGGRRGDGRFEIGVRLALAEASTI